MEKNNQTYNMLSEPFPPEMERELRKSGTSLTYIPVSEVITRLNKVIGVDKWSFEIISCGRDAIDPDYIVAHVRLMWYSDNDGWTTVPVMVLAVRKLSAQRTATLLTSVTR